MSLGGIAIAMGALVDAAIVVVEQTHKKLELGQRDGRRRLPPGRHRGRQRGGPASFFALLVIAVSFLPVLTLEAQEGRLFKPLAYTKTLTMIVAAVLAITLDPALRVLFTRMHASVPAGMALPGRQCSLPSAAFTRGVASYQPLPHVAVRAGCAAGRCAGSGWSLARAGLVAVTVPVYQELGSEFMPPLDEGSLLYMPSTMPGIAIAKRRSCCR